MRILIWLLISLGTSFPAFGQNLYFVSVAWVSPERQIQYNDFMRQVVPIWERHGMKVLVRGRVLGALVDTAATPLPTEIALLQIESRQQFNNYIADPDYRKIREIRTEPLESMIVLEGTDSDMTDLSRLRTAPQLAVLFGPAAPSSEQPDLSLSISDIGAIKGKVPDPFATTANIGLFALSFDDNPMSFLPTEGSGMAFILEPIE